MEDLHVIEPTIQNVNFIYGTNGVAYHWMAWRIRDIDPPHNGHIEIQQMCSSQEIGRLIERLMREAPVDWACLVTNSTPLRNEEIAAIAIEAVTRIRDDRPDQKAFRYVPAHLEEGQSDRS